MFDVDFLGTTCISEDLAALGNSTVDKVALKIYEL